MKIYKIKSEDCENPKQYNRLERSNVNDYLESEIEYKIDYKDVDIASIHHNYCA